MPTVSLLTALERTRFDFGHAAGVTKLTLLGLCLRARLRSARDVARLHEMLCFMRAYPDDARVLAAVEDLLARFAQRADLRHHRAALADSGIAGTTIYFRFFHAQAQWLTQHWPAHLTLDRSDIEADTLIARALPVLLTSIEVEALRELKLSGYAALDRLRARGETDAAFLVRRIAAMPGSGPTRQAFADAIDASFELRPGIDTPSRTHAKFDRAPFAYRRTPLIRERPDLRTELARTPRAIRRLSARRGQQIVNLARGAMATRARALEAFSYANARDVWMIDDGDGLAYALSGALADRRHTIAAIYGGLTLRNGVPIGYLQADVVGRMAALSFNTFDTFRGGEAAFTFARLLAALRHAFGTTSFSIEPYQLGQGNEEGLASGAWWFYYKLGFRPRDAATLRLVRAELERVRRNARHRSSEATLRTLAARHMFFDLDPAHPHPLPPLAALGLRVGRLLAQQGGTDRDRALDDLSQEAMRQCGLVSLRGFSPDQRVAWNRWAPFTVMMEPQTWNAAERQALVDVIRAKGGRSEREFVARFAAHSRLDAAIEQLGRRAR
jgi:hypothetical protein